MAITKEIKMDTSNTEFNLNRTENKQKVNDREKDIYNSLLGSANYFTVSHPHGLHIPIK